MKKDVRKIKVYEQCGYKYKPTPTITLKGQWLEALGFGAGTLLTVQCEEGKLVIAGILMTMCESRTKLCKVLTEEVAENFQEQIRVFDTKIPNTVKVGESFYYSLPVVQCSPEASAGVAYRKFAKELILYEG